MSTDLMEARDAALALDAEERSRLIDQLVHSMVEDTADFSAWLRKAERRWETIDPEASDAAHTPMMDAHFQEALSRAEAIDRGELQTVDGAEAMARVRKLLEDTLETK